jgi:hypothetical protein
LDSATRPEQDTGDRPLQPDESASNPYLGEAADSTARAGEEQVSPNFSNGATQGGEGGGIPLGLRDLVKDYFSSLDQK